MEAGWTARDASESAIAEAVKRRQGRGRRPSRQALDRRLKRQGLGVELFDRLMQRLEALAGARPPTADDSLAAVRRAVDEANRP